MYLLLIRLEMALPTCDRSEIAVDANHESVHAMLCRAAQTTVKHVALIGSMQLQKRSLRKLRILRKINSENSHHSQTFIMFLNAYKPSTYQQKPSIRYGTIIRLLLEYVKNTRMLSEVSNR